jgi:DMSO/TMAO reductase YedYZ heme-binding membrane subunit
VNGQFWWYVVRASGVVAWLLLTASVLWGIVLSTKAFPRHRRPAWLLDLHRWLGGLTICFVGIHLTALVADNYTTFTLADLAIPFASTWKPGAVALGVVAAWSLLAVEVTSLAMKRLPRKFWHTIHLVSYLTFWLTSLHAAFAGTDRSQRLYQVTAAISIAAVVWAMTYRMLHRKAPRPSGPRPAAHRTPPSGAPVRRVRTIQRPDAEAAAGTLPTTASTPRSQ